VVATRRLAPVPFATLTLRAAALALALLLVTTGCSAASFSLADREFLSTAVLDGGAPFALAPGTRIRLGFAVTDLAVSAGCNHIGGTYRIDGGRLMFEGVAMTEMGCDQQRDTQDQWLVTFLTSKPAVQLLGTDLTLDNGQTVIRLADRAVVEPDLNIAGPTWTVVSILDGDTAASVPTGATATLVFGADGTLEVDDGCNRGSGRWAVEGTGIRVRDVILTKMACDGPAGTLESAVLAVINEGSIAAEIKANMLTLQAGGRGLQLQGS
jgi:heat shock protein HslJ